REPRDGEPGGAQHRRPTHPGGKPLPVRRDEPGAGVRPLEGLRDAPGHPGGDSRSLRAGREQDPAAGGGCPREGDPRRQRARRWPGQRGRPRTVPRRGEGRQVLPPGATMSRRIDRRHYADLYGPTTGDRVRLGDTALVAEVERDLTTYGDECKFGGGKVLRDGQGQKAGAADHEALDVVVTNALIVDHTGIYKADVGIKDGRIAGIGKAGNPDVMAGVTPGMVV